MNPHALPTGHSYHTSSRKQAEKCAALHNSKVADYGMGSLSIQNMVFWTKKMVDLCLSIGTPYKDHI